jgi:hypothetical protein
MKLVLARYSKAKTIKDIKENLRIYPEQRCNTMLGYDYTMEFVEYYNENGPVGSLLEFVEFDKETEFEIICGDDKIDVVYVNGIFVEKKSTTIENKLLEIMKQMEIVMGLKKLRTNNLKLEIE